MHLLRPAVVSLALLASVAGCASDDDYYQYRTVTYAVSVVGPHDTFIVWYRDGRDIREEHPASTKWQTTVTDKFYEAAGLEMRADAYAPENASPVPTKVECEIAVDGKTYSKNSYTHTASCIVDFDEVTTAPRPAPSAATGGGSSLLAPALWLGAAALTVTAVARWAYVRRRKSRGTWPSPRRG